MCWCDPPPPPGVAPPQGDDQEREPPAHLRDGGRGVPLFAPPEAEPMHRHLGGVGGRQDRERQFPPQATRHPGQGTGQHCGKGY